MIKKAVTQRECVIKMKHTINDFVTNFTKRYRLFPWTKLDKISKIKFDTKEPVTVQGNEYTVQELIKLINRNKTLVKMRLKVSYYNPTIKAFLKESKCVDENEIKSVYATYDKELKKQFNETREKLIFCLDGLKALNKYLKDVPVSESYISTICESINSDLSYDDPLNDELEYIIEKWNEKMNELESEES